jgi:hypothetical protein
METKDFPAVIEAKKIVNEHIKYYNDMMKDESHLPVEQQSLVFRLRKRAEIRRQIQGRKSVEEGKPDRIADLLEEAANEIERLEADLRDCDYRPDC